MTQVNRPGIIVNHDYPFRYYSGGHWLWDIVFNSSSYVNLILFNVSFNLNQDKVTFIVHFQSLVVNSTFILVRDFT